MMMSSNITILRNSRSKLLFSSSRTTTTRSRITTNNNYNTLKRLFSTSTNNNNKNPLRIPNKIISQEERNALRKARKERGLINLQQVQQAEKAGVGSGEAASLKTSRAAATETSAGASSTANSASALKNAKRKSSPYIWYLGLGLPTIVLVWGLNDTESPPAKFAKMIGLSKLIESFTDDVMKPSHEKLLPDWSQIPNVPHDIPVPHTLVLDLENTLVSSTWDRQYGWRHAKRPGVDKFLHDMAQYYEIVLFTPSIDAIAEPVINNLDKTGCIMHRLFRDATYYYNGIHVKDISKLNRPLNRIVVLDDDPNEVYFHKDTNLIKVKPYEDPTDRSDNTLKRITPFLIEIARENYNDIPSLLQQFQGMDADEIANEQDRRIQSIKDNQIKKSQRGLRGTLMLGGNNTNNLPEPELKPMIDDGKYTPQPVPGQPGGAPVHQLTAKEIAGTAPPPLEEDDQGTIYNWFTSHQKEKEEHQMRKMEKWNEIMMKKQKDAAEKAAKAQAEAEQQQQQQQQAA